MDEYTRMKLSERMDSEAVKIEDYELSELLDAYEKNALGDAERFKQEYKSFYTDIKTDRREDW